MKRQHSDHREARDRSGFLLGVLQKDRGAKPTLNNTHAVRVRPVSAAELGNSEISEGYRAVILGVNEVIVSPPVASKAMAAAYAIKPIRAAIAGGWHWEPFHRQAGIGEEIDGSGLIHAHPGHLAAAA